MNERCGVERGVSARQCGFLRRECPTCEREFKWLPAQDDADATPSPDGGYFCPYCGIQSRPDAWYTKPQLAVIEAVVQRQVVGPALDKFDRSLRRMERQSGGLIKVSTRRDRPAEPPAITEDDNMRRVDFGCHLTEPVRVLDDWAGSVLCLICGRPAAE